MTIIRSTCQLSLASLLTVFLLTGLPTTASAHSTGKEVRHIDACGDLRSRWRKRACRRCLRRDRRHHFHPRARRGKSCVLNRGIHRRVGCNQLGGMKRFWCKRCIRKGGYYQPRRRMGKRCRR